MNYDPKSRRHFLKGLGGVTVALPFLPSLLPAQAQAADKPKLRFIALHTGHCQAVEQWHPDYSKLQWSEQTGRERMALLSSIQGNISPVLASAWDPLRGKINLLSRLDSTSAAPNHNAEVILSGGVNTEISETLDQVLASKLGAGSPLNLYVRSVFDQYYSGASHVSVSKGAYSPGQFNPASVFKNLFNAPSGGGAGADALQRRDLATVDLVLNQFKILRANKRLSKLDAERLDRHMELVNQTEKRLKDSLGSGSGGAVNKCANASGPNSSPVFSPNAADYQVVVDQMLDVVELAIKCGKVQVATVMLHAYSYFDGSLGFIPGVSGGVRMHEDIGHAGTPELRAMKLSLNRWFGERVARFLKNLDVIEDASTGSTYLDNSLVLWANDQGSFQDGNAHSSINLPVLLAGKAGGFIKTGQYIDYGPAYANLNRAVAGDEYGVYKKGRPYNQLLVTIAQAMGLSPSSYESTAGQGFGVYGGRTNEYSGLPGNHRRDILPFLKA
jgi:hypothetical protein